MEKRKEIETLVKKIEKIETAVEPKFQDHFVEAMAFPHKTNPYPILSSQIKMPEALDLSERENQNKKRRRKRTRNV